MTWVLLSIGAAGLGVGANWFVGGVARVVLSLRAERMVALAAVATGAGAVATVVVAVQAAAGGRPELAIGAILGANAANLGLVTGVVVLLAPPHAASAPPRHSILALLASSYALLAVLVDGRVTAVEGAGLLLGAVAYALLRFRWAGPERLLQCAASIEATAQAADVIAHPLGDGGAYAAGAALIGLGMVVLGGGAFVVGTASAMDAWRLGGLTAGVSLAAAGTWLPGLLAAALLAARSRPAVAISNVLAASTFNALGGLGALGLIGGVRATADDLLVHLMAVLALTLIHLLLFWPERPLRRWQGGVLVAVYLAYVGLAGAW